MLTDSGIGIWELCSLPGLNTSGLAASLLSVSGRPASLATLKQQRAHGCSQIDTFAMLFTGGILFVVMISKSAPLIVSSK